MLLQLASANGHVLHHAAAGNPAPDQRGPNSCCSNDHSPSGADHGFPGDRPDRDDEQHDCYSCVICNAMNDPLVVTSGQTRLLEIAGTAAAATIAFEPGVFPSAECLPPALPPPIPQTLHFITLPLRN
jgi:hypothetical protein